MALARILCVDDDESVLQFLVTTLGMAGMDVITAASPRQAIVTASDFKFDLFVTDVDLPEMSGFEYRAEIRKLPRYTETPFVFVSGAEAKVEVEIALQLGRDRLLLKPLSRVDLKRAVNVALGLVRFERGPLPGALDPILGAIMRGNETGILTAMRGNTRKRVVFQDGKIAFAASNDPRDLIGQAFIRAGLIAEHELAAAIGSVKDDEGGQGRATADLSTMLSALHKITPEQSRTVFEKKISEVVLDVFLWTDGIVEYAEGGVERTDRPFPISLDLMQTRAEGLKRRAQWAEVTKLLPDGTAKFMKEGSWPEGFTKNPGDAALARYVEAGLSLAQILLEFRGQDFAVGRRIAQLVRKRILRPVPSTGFHVAARTGGPVGIQDVLTALNANDQAARPLAAEDLLAELEQQSPPEKPPAGAPAQPPPRIERPAPGGVHGNLTDFGLVELIQTLGMGMKTAKIALTHAKHGEASIFIDRGQIVSVLARAANGEEGFYHLASWVDGTFQVENGAVTLDHNIVGASNDMLMLEALRRLDEAALADRGTSAIGRTGVVLPQAPPAGFAYPSPPAAAVPASAPPPVIAAISTPASAPPRQSAEELAAELLADALGMLRAEDLHGARGGLLAALSLDPLNALAQQRLEEVDNLLGAQAVADGLGPEQRVKLALGIDELRGRAVSPNAGFVLSRLAAESMTVGDLLCVCPIPEGELLQMLQDFIRDGVLAKAN